ncbi:hypothetical protein NMY22_g1694 [Coprinellus aureogranulatus]|nr:hypothetical protein NMY22_g1694 [Coprinellus aureogranulatus]
MLRSNLPCIGRKKGAAPSGSSQEFFLVDSTYDAHSFWLNDSPAARENVRSFYALPSMLQDFFQERLGDQLQATLFILFLALRASDFEFDALSRREWTYQDRFARAYQGKLGLVVSLGLRPIVAHEVCLTLVAFPDALRCRCLRAHLLVYTLAHIILPHQPWLHRPDEASTLRRRLSCLIFSKNPWHHPRLLCFALEYPSAFSDFSDTPEKGMYILGTLGGTLDCFALHSNTKPAFPTFQTLSGRECTYLYRFGRVYQAKPTASSPSPSPVPGPQLRTLGSLPSFAWTSISGSVLATALIAISAGADEDLYILGFISSNGTMPLKQRRYSWGESSHYHNRLELIGACSWQHYTTGDDGVTTIGRISLRWATELWYDADEVEQVTTHPCHPHPHLHSQSPLWSAASLSPGSTLNIDEMRARKVDTDSNASRLTRTSPCSIQPVKTPLWTMRP